MRVNQQNYNDRYDSRAQSSSQYTPRYIPPFKGPRSPVNNSRNNAKTPPRGDGYWAEMIIKDEKGNPKSMKAWVLNDN